MQKKIKMLLLFMQLLRFFSCMNTVIQTMFFSICAEVECVPKPIGTV